MQNGTALLEFGAEKSESFERTSPLNSPFAAASLSLSAEQAQPAYPGESFSVESPFSEAAVWDEHMPESVALESLLTELEDDDFTEALEGLANEAAARHLTSSASWSSESEASSLAESEAEGWMAGVSSEAEQLIERLDEYFSGRTVESLSAGELESVGAQLLADFSPISQSMEQFLGGLIKKAGKMVKGVVNVAKKGIATVGKFLPLGKLWATLRKLVRPLLQRVLKMAMNKLPPRVRPIAQTLAKKFLGEAEEYGVPTIEETAEHFDQQLASAFLAGNDSAAEAVFQDAEAEAHHQGPDTISALDGARARLARQLRERQPGDRPIEEMEQFIPVVMAALPIIKLGIGIVGRDRVVGFLAARLADLVKGHIGEQAASAIARPITDVGLRLLSLEAEAEEPARLGSEALVATLEDTVRTVMELSAEALEDRVLVEAELQEAFAAAAARHLPRMLLRPDLPAVETVGGSGVWVYMPRRTRPCFRYKKFSHVYQVPISRPAARMVRFPSGDTLERRLLDAGARVWPVQAEVEVYEAIPGTQFGHLAAFESESFAGESYGAADEFEYLTPEVASALVNEPGQGRPAPAKRGALRPGARLFRLKIAGRALRRTGRFGLRLDTSSAAPVLRLHMRMSEREAHAAAEALAKGQPATVVTMLKGMMSPAFEAALAHRVGRHLARKAQAQFATERPAALANALATAALTAASASLSSTGPALAQAAKDPAAGITLTFEFRFSDMQTLLSGTPGSPDLRIQAGWRRD